MRTVTNDVPQVLLDVARDAMRLGISEITLGFMYAGADFPSPIEWALHLMKRENRFDAPADAPRVHVVLTMQRDDDAPRAYVGVKSDNPYWDVEQVTAWMHESVEADGEYIPAWAPVTNEAVHEHLLAAWEPFHEGVLSGWTMAHKAQWDQLASLQAFYDREASDKQHEPKSAGLLPQTSLRWDMTNTFYNEKKHPSYRGDNDDDSGAPLSVGGYSFRRTNGAECIGLDAYRSLKKAPYRASISPEEMRETLQASAPWFVRVAGYSEKKEKWTHFPEAKDWKKSEEGAARAVADTQRALAMCEVPVTK
jgi:hypothetical protein